MATGRIRANLQHHLAILGLAGQVHQLGNDQKRDRDDFLNWISPEDYEEAYDNIF
jgi:hypothetical protein